MVNSREGVHERLLLLAGRAVPQAHSVAEFVRHETLQGVRIGGRKIKIDPSGEQQSVFVLLQRIKERVVLAVVLVDLAARNRQTTLAVVQSVSLAGICEFDS